MRRRESSPRGQYCGLCGASSWDKRLNRRSRVPSPLRLALTHTSSENASSSVPSTGRLGYRRAQQPSLGNTHIATPAAFMVKSNSPKEIGPNMPAKKTRSKPGLKKPTLSKSDFIRQQPASMPANEVVAKAKAVGLKFAPQLVYKVRGRAKTKKSTPKKTSAMVATAPMTSATKPPKSKSAFIRNLPSSTPAKEVVEQAKAAGIKLNVGYVYNVRGAAKKAAKQKRGAAKSPAVGTPTNGGGARRSANVENLLKAVAAEIGLGPATEILAGERARVAAVIGG
jgi:hypothetical protein